MQGSVLTFDPTSQSGAVVLDDGRVFEFDGRVFARSPLRLVRYGQRVNIRLADQRPGEGERVVELTLGTFPLESSGND